ncbi:MAG: tRNA-dihydrouridine synthase family protein [archaeon]
MLSWFEGYLKKVMLLIVMMGSLKIGSLKLKNCLVLAPMVDVTDCVYRKLCRDAGASLAFTEMIYVDAILHSNPKTLRMMEKFEGEKPVGLQITGNGVREIERFVESKKWKGFDLIDLNCGCPSKRITGNEAGSYLLREPEKIGEMVRVLKKTGKPVSVKVRLGFKKNNVLEVAKVVEKAGADTITVHARLAVDGSGVGAKWNWIRKVKEEVGIPVIGNGDVFSISDAERMMKETGCDGVMIARGAIGDVGIFGRATWKIDGGKDGKLRISTGGLKLGVERRGSSGAIVDKDVNERLKMLRRYLKLQREYFGKDVDMGKVKYVGGKFLRGFARAREMRGELGKCKTLREMEKMVRDVVDEFL